jgi:hypothetical protein
MTPEDQLNMDKCHDQLVNMGLTSQKALSVIEYWWSMTGAIPVEIYPFGSDYGTPRFNRKVTIRTMR